MEDVSLYFLPEEQVNVIVLEKGLYDFPDGTAEVQFACKTIHPYNHRIINLYFHYPNGFVNSVPELKDLIVGRFYSIKGTPKILCVRGKINETFYSPEYGAIGLDDLDPELIAHTIGLVEENQLVTRVSAMSLEEVKEYSKREAFYWLAANNELKELLEDKF